MQYCLHFWTTALPKRCTFCTSCRKAPNVLRFGTAAVKKCRMYCVLPLQLSKSAECIAFCHCSCQKVPNVLRFATAVVKKCRMYCVLTLQLSKSAECTAFWHGSCQKVPNVLRFDTAVVKKC